MSKIVNIIGNVSQIGELQVVSEKFVKQEVIIKTVEERPQFYPIEFVQDNTDFVADLAVGQSVNITCNLEGREYTNATGKYNVFIGLKGWKISKV
jgi:hypothetical protein